VAITGEQIPAIHYVVEGRCAVALPDETEPLWLEAGDVLFMRRGPDRLVHDGSGVSPIALDEAITLGANHGAVVFELDGGGAPSQILGAGIVLGGPSRKVLLEALPERFVLRAEDSHTTPSIAGQLECLTREAEQPGPGSRLIISRITEVLFLLLLRAYGEREELGGWLGAARNPQIGAALSAIHRQPERDWTVDGLARFVGMSRSSFSAKFQRLVGAPPLRYLTSVRMDHAVELLTHSQLNIAAIAEQVGYGSEPAFATAFKRWHGSTPGTFRRALVEREAAAHDSSSEPATG